MATSSRLFCVMTNHCFGSMSPAHKPQSQCSLHDCTCSMKEEQQQRQQAAKEQHLKSLARGHEAAQADRLRARAQQTKAQLSTADQAQRAKRAQALNPTQPAQLGLRYEGTHITSAFAPNALAPSACGKWQKLMHCANKLSLCTSEVTTEVATLT